MSTSRPLSAARTWFITGASTGFGRALTELALNKGEQVVATARRPEVLGDLVEAYPRQALAVRLDVTDPEQVTSAVALALDRFGRLDVVVNNAGYGLLGGVEEVTDEQIRAQFDTNLFGALAVTRAVLPQLRQQGAGHLVQISSTAGQGTAPSLGIYCATKWALEAFSEALAAEVAPLGIRVTIVEPGAFRTDFATRSLITATPMPEYDATVGQMKHQLAQMFAQIDHLGDPAAAARAIFDVVEAPTPPLRLPLGANATATIRSALATRQEELEKWVATSTSPTRGGRI